MYKVQLTSSYIGYAKVGSVNFVQKEKIKDSIFIEQQKKYHEIVSQLNKQ
jgi:hypothetical protein